MHHRDVTVVKVVEMMKVYFERTRCEKSTADELETLASRLSISESVEEVLYETCEKVVIVHMLQ